MDDIYKDIIHLKPRTYDNKRFLTQFFCASEKTTNESFKRMVEVVLNKWILGDATCMVVYVIKTYNTKYRKLEGSNVWNKSSNKDTNSIALTIVLND